MDLLFIIEFNGMNVLKHLPEMWLHCSRFLGLRQDLQKIIIAEEVESSKLLSLLFEVVVQLLLDDFEVLVGFKQPLQ